MKKIFKKSESVFSGFEDESEKAVAAKKVINDNNKALEKELKKLRLELELRKNLSAELEKQKTLAIEANNTAKEKAKELDKLLKRQKLEAQLRKNLADEMEKQKELAINAQKLAVEKKAEIESISNQLSKYLSPQIYHSIFSGEKQADIVSQRKKLTVFFSDIVGFTDISDALEAEEISSMLNYYLTEMSQIALAHGGTIDKYIGDAILVFFGDPETEGVQQDAINCVNMAVSMQLKMEELKNEWSKKFGLREPLEIRIGIATGYCTVGNFGSEDRLDYTVIGSQVNLAARLEALSKPGAILISFDTYSQISNEINCKELGKVAVKGIREEVRTFEVLLDPGIGPSIKEIQTDNLRLTANIERLADDELDQVENFVQELRGKVKN
tara:strand:- start:1505 stop:2659 length:1155 start_codon:yes stop_codon:yes gene_type:complete